MVMTKRVLEGVGIVSSPVSTVMRSQHTWHLWEPLVLYPHLWLPDSRTENMKSVLSKSANLGSSVMAALENEYRFCYWEVKCCYNKYLQTWSGFGTGIGGSQKSFEVPARKSWVSWKTPLVEKWPFKLLPVRSPRSKWRTCYWILEKDDGVRKWQRTSLNCVLCFMKRRHCDMVDTVSKGLGYLFS